MKLRTLKDWVRRRRVTGHAVTDDEIWERINKNWPTLSDEWKETIFQGIRR
jgi:hypothetical protein